MVQGSIPLPPPSLFWRKRGERWTLFEGDRDAATEGDPAVAVAELRRPEGTVSERFTLLANGWSFGLLGDVRAAAQHRRLATDGLLCQGGVRRAKTAVERLVGEVRSPPLADGSFIPLQHPESPPDRPLSRLRDNVYAGWVETEHGTANAWIERRRRNRWVVWIDRQIAVSWPFPTTKRAALARVAEHLERQHRHALNDARLRAEQEAMERQRAAQRSVFDDDGARRFLAGVVARVLPPGWRPHFVRAEGWLAIGFYRENVSPVHNLGPRGPYEAGYQEWHENLAVAMDGDIGSYPDPFDRFEELTLDLLRTAVDVLLSPDGRLPDWCSPSDGVRFGYYTIDGFEAEGPRNPAALALTLRVDAAATAPEEGGEPPRFASRSLELPLPLPPDPRPLLEALRAEVLAELTARDTAFPRPV